MEFIDTHTHLFSDDFNGDESSIHQRAVGNGVNKMLLPNIDTTSISALKELVMKYPLNYFPMMGLHPCSVGETYISDLEIIKSELYSGKYYAVGEIGLDLYWDKTTLPSQLDAFSKQCEWAVNLNLPVSIHTREATQQAIDSLALMHQMPLGVFHCFVGTNKEAHKIVELGFCLGIGGVITFKNSTLSESLRDIPLESLVLETDSPYLSPVPYRGKRNESSYLPLVASKLAELYQTDIERVAAVTSLTAQAIFSI